MSTYVVVIEDAGPNFSAHVLDLPGCVSAGDTVDEVTLNIREAIGMNVEALHEFGEEVSPASSRVAVVDVNS